MLALLPSWLFPEMEYGFSKTSAQKRSENVRLSLRQVTALGVGQRKGKASKNGGIAGELNYLRVC